MKDFIMYSYTR